MPEAQGLTEGPVTLRLVSAPDGGPPDLDELGGFYLSVDGDDPNFVVSDGGRGTRCNRWSVPLLVLLEAIHLAKEPNSLVVRHMPLTLSSQNPDEPMRRERIELRVDRLRNRLEAIVENSRVILPLDRALALLKRARP